MIADLAMTVGLVTPTDIVRDVKRLPSAPKVLPRLKRLLGDGNSTMSEIVALIRLDPGIAARVLQVANSAYYSKGARCATVDEAVLRVGYDQIYELVAYAVASQVLVRPLVTYGIEADDLWKSSVACALAAELLAARSGEDSNVAYTVGLLHGLGMVAVDEWALRHAPDLFFRSESGPREATESERTALGFTQADVGAALLQHWEFPTEMCDPVQWQYAPLSSTGQVRMACLLYTAKWVRSAVCAGPGKTRPTLPVSSVLLRLGLSLAALNSLTVEVAKRLEGVSSLLSVGESSRAIGAYRFPRES